MYQHYARSGPEADGDSPSQAVAILSVERRPLGIRIVDVNTDYQRLWGGGREQWLGAVTASFGEVEATAEESVKSAMKRVDDALYQAKAQGRDQVAPSPSASAVKQA